MAEQEEVKRLAEAHGPENLVVIFGVNETPLLRIMTSTFRKGDPSYAGALAGVALNLDCFHILELKDAIPAEIWQEHMALEELQIDDAHRERIFEAMRDARRQ